MFVFIPAYLFLLQLYSWPMSMLCERCAAQRALHPEVHCVLLFSNSLPHHSPAARVSYVFGFGPLNPKWSVFEIHFSYCSSLRSLQHRGIHLLVDGRPHCTSKRSCQLCLGFRCHDGWIYVNLVMAMDGSNNSNTSHEISELIGVFKSAPRSGSKWIQSTIARLWSMVPQPSQRNTTVIGASSATVPIRGLRGFWTWNPGISQRLTSTK